jgi:hypothetical protein
MKRLYFGMGKNDHILPQKIIGKINDVTRSKNIPIGRIDLYGDYSYVDVEESFVPLILDCFADPHNNPRGIVVEVAKDQPERKKSSEKRDFGEKKERKERRERDDFREKRDRHDDDFFEKKSKKKKKDFDDDRTYYKSERSRDGREWLDPDWKDRLDDIEVFIDDDDRPSRKQRNAERGFGAKKGSGSSRGGSSRGGSSRGSASRSSSSRDSGRGRRGAARYEDDYYSPRRRGGGRRR